MASKMFTKCWITVAFVLFLLLFVILFPMVLNRYGVPGVLLLSPLLIIGVILAFIRSYKISRWTAESRREEEESE